MIYNANKQCDRQLENSTENHSGMMTKHKSLLLNSYCVYVAILGSYHFLQNGGPNYTRES